MADPKWISAILHRPPNDGEPETLANMGLMANEFFYDGPEGNERILRLLEIIEVFRYFLPRERT